MVTILLRPWKFFRPRTFPGPLEFVRLWHLRAFFVIVSRVHLRVQRRWFSWHWQHGFCENLQKCSQFYTKLIWYILSKVWSNQLKIYCRSCDRAIENHRAFLKVKSTNLLHDLLVLLDGGVWGDWLVWHNLQFVFSLEQHEQCCHYRRMSVLYEQAAITLGECCLIWWFKHLPLMVVRFLSTICSATALKISIHRLPLNLLGVSRQSSSVRFSIGSKCIAFAVQQMNISAYDFCIFSEEFLV